jgi:hypothetical protein
MLFTLSLYSPIVLSASISRKHEISSSETLSCQAAFLGPQFVALIVSTSVSSLSPRFAYQLRAISMDMKDTEDFQIVFHVNFSNGIDLKNHYVSSG